MSYISMVRPLAVRSVRRRAVRSRLWYILSPFDGASVREAHCAVRRTEAPCAQASTAAGFSARSALRAGYWYLYENLRV